MAPAGTLIAIVLAGAAQAAPAGAVPKVDPCTLLSAGDIRAVQKVPVKQTKPTETTVRSERFSQCVYLTADFAHSVSLTVITGQSGAEGTQAFWKRTFEDQRPKKEREAGRVPASLRKSDEGGVRRVPGIGDDAVWTGDGKAGSLYVRTPGRVLRISVGGVADPEERLKRTRTLADAALQRLPR